MKLPVLKHIEKIIPYPSATPQDGLTDLIKLASNENPQSPSQGVVDAITAVLPKLNRYPDSSGYALSQAIAEKCGVSQSEVVLGNGSDDLIACLIKTFVEKGCEVISSHPSFLMYTKGVEVIGGINTIIPLQDMQHNLGAILEAINEHTRLIFLDNPNNPTGSILSPVELYTFLSEVPEDVVVVLDEAYIEFAGEDYILDAPSLLRNTNGRAAVVFLRTFSKAYGLPGLRLGYGLMHEEVALLLHKVRQPFNVNMLAQAAGIAVLSDTETYQKTLVQNKKGMSFLEKGLQGLGCVVYPSHTNFLLFDVQGSLQNDKNCAESISRSMLTKGILVRPMSSYGLPRHIRVTCGTELENQRFLEVLEETFFELGLRK